MTLKKLAGKKTWSSCTYNWLIDKCGEPDTAARFMWEKELKVEIDDKLWTESIIRIRKITLATKLQYFQHKITFRILSTNVKSK